MKKVYALLAILFCAFSPAKHIVTITGIVTDKQTSQPVANAYLVAVDGEEEALSADNGKFKLRTTLSLPFKITIKHSGYEQSSAVVTDTSGTLLVQLNPYK